MKAELHTGERLDDLMLKGFKIIQDPSRFCFGIDSVLLSDFVKVKKDETVLDLGTGTGILPILLAAKTSGAHFTGLEIQKESLEMAKRSVDYNHLTKKIDIVQGDIKQASVLFRPALFDVILTNPPYMKEDHGRSNSKDALAISRHEILCRLPDILRESAALLRANKGRFYMVHKPFRLVEIFMRMKEYKIEPKRIQFVHPYLDKEPSMVLIEGVKGGRSRLTVEPPLILSDRKGV